jgi:hypothetical protein
LNEQLDRVVRHLIPCGAGWINHSLHDHAHGQGYERLSGNLRILIAE